MKIIRFEDLEVWQKARELIRDIYKLTVGQKFSKDFGLKEQIQRSAVSIMSNIAEGFERKTAKEFIQFLYIAKGSSGELRSQLYVAYDLGYSTDEDFNKCLSKSEQISKSIGGFIKYLKFSNLKSLNLQLKREV